MINIRTQIVPVALAVLVLGLAQPPVFVADAASAAGAVADGPDFDGDGYGDLAVGALYDDVPGFQSREGSVTVLYGDAGGLSTARAQYWHQGTPGILDKPEVGDQFGFATSWGDFDADGFDDLVVGVAVEGLRLGEQGAVAIIYGSPAGLVAAGNQLLTSAVPQYADYFGAALAAADFNGDGFDDMAASSPRNGAAGSVSVYFGGAGGLDPGTAQYLDEATLGLPTGTLTWFGSSVAAGDTDGDGLADLAIGMPWDNVEPLSQRCGSVAVIMGSADGLALGSVVGWSQDTPGVPGELNPYDSFGVVTMGDFDADGFGDLAIGAPRDDEDDVPASSVTVLYGSATGLTAARSQRWDQRMEGVGDKNEPVDWFGYTFAVADFDGDGADDLVIGNPRESIRTGGQRVARAGQASVLYGGPAGLSVEGSQRWDQDSRRIKDVAEDLDFFSYAMVAGDFDADGSADLAVGTPNEDELAGVVHVIRGSESGLTGRQNQRWTQAIAGMPGEKGSGHFFGCGMGSTLGSCDNN